LARYFECRINKDTLLQTVFFGDFAHWLLVLNLVVITVTTREFPAKFNCRKSPYLPVLSEDDGTIGVRLLIFDDAMYLGIFPS